MRQDTEGRQERKRRPTIELIQNVKLVSGRMPQTEPLTMQMPEEEDELARFFYYDQRLSLFAHVSKGISRSCCNDAALAIIDDDKALVGVLDGYGTVGRVLPGILCEEIMKGWYESGSYIDNAEDMAELLYHAALSVRERLTRPIREGGTTATIAALLPGNRYVAASIGDSALYYISPEGGVERMFDYNLVYVLNSKKPRDITAPNVRLGTEGYRYIRRILGNSVTGSGLEKYQLEISQGHMEDGSMLMLATDGITKNLSIGIDNDNVVRDVSGCRDLEALFSRGRGVKQAGDELVSLLEARARHGKTVFNNDNTVLIPYGDDMSLMLLSHRQQMSNSG